MTGAARQREGSNPPLTTRERILAAARSLFAELGYAGTSVRMIARNLGISDPAVHYHFPTKQSLYQALLTEPDYGVLPLDLVPLTRETLIDQVMHLFGWWTARPEFGQMLLREQLERDDASVAFISSSDEVWARGVTGPLGELLGEAGPDVSAMLFEMLAGLFWDAILSFGDHFAETVAQDYFRARIRAIVECAIPESGTHHG